MVHLNGRIIDHTLTPFKAGAPLSLFLLLHSLPAYSVLTFQSLSTTYELTDLRSHNIQWCNTCPSIMIRNDDKYCGLNVVQVFCCFSGYSDNDILVKQTSKPGNASLNNMLRHDTQKCNKYKERPTFLRGLKEDGNEHTPRS